MSSPRNWFTLEGTVCVLAGSAGIIGTTCANALLDMGAIVHSFDLKRPKIKSSSFHFAELDITRENELTNYFKSLPSEKMNWAFVNCTYPRSPAWGTLDFRNVSLTEWNQNLTLHLGSAFTFAKLAVNTLLTQNCGGSLVHFGSIYGELGPDLSIYEGTTMKNPAPYAAIKAGIGGISRYIATTFGTNGIRSNLICPGGVFNGQPETFVNAYIQRTPLGRMATPADIGGVVAFLCGPSAAYITGQTIMVDGGWSAW